MHTLQERKGEGEGERERGGGGGGGGGERERERRGQYLSQHMNPCTNTLHGSADYSSRKYSIYYLKKRSLAHQNSYSLLVFLSLQSFRLHLYLYIQNNMSELGLPTV